MKISDATQISLPARNLIAILAAVAIGTMSFFSIQERLNKLETNQQLMAQDMEAANDFIDGVPKGTMVSPQINELFMLVEWLSKTQEELRTHVNKEIPEISKLNMQLQFIEERMIDVEMLIDKIRQNGISHD
jgi:hypothetical protein